MAMLPRQSLPRIWMMTDERQGSGVVGAVRNLPQGGGVVFRHYSLAEAERRALFDEVLAEARGRGLTVLLGGLRSEGELWGADGGHGWGSGRGLRSVSVHNLREMRLAEAEGADLLFVSPVFPTRSHPGGKVLGPHRFAQLAAQARRPVIALGGVTQVNAGKLLRLGAYGWAGIDAWTPA
jgi:thiamine-phosphate pyrophosphorylase